MNKVKNYLKSYLIFSIIILIYIVIISILYYFELFNYKTLNIINYIFTIIDFFILGFIISKKEKNKGYFNGFMISTILIILFCIISLILNKITYASLVYYLTLIISSIIGGIIGVTK